MFFSIFYVYRAIGVAYRLRLVGGFAARDDKVEHHTYESGKSYTTDGETSKGEFGPTDA